MGFNSGFKGLNLATDTSIRAGQNNNMHF